MLAHGAETALGLTDGHKRVRADWDPRLLPWTAVVSTDYLNGF